jgi:hypothetical protein
MTHIIMQCISNEYDTLNLFACIEVLISDANSFISLVASRRALPSLFNS